MKENGLDCNYLDQVEHINYYILSRNKILPSFVLEDNCQWSTDKRHSCFPWPVSGCSLALFLLSNNLVGSEGGCLLCHGSSVGKSSSTSVVQE